MRLPAGLNINLILAVIAAVLLVYVLVEHTNNNTTAESGEGRIEEHQAHPSQTEQKEEQQQQQVQQQAQQRLQQQQVQHQQQQQQHQQQQKPVIAPAKAGAKSVSSSSSSSGKLHIVMTATNSHGSSSPTITSLRDCLGSICEHTRESMVLHMVTDSASRDDVAATVRQTCPSSQIELTLYDADELVNKAKVILGDLQQHFSSGGYYGQGIFFLEPVFHLVLPQEIERLAVLDLDLHFTTDIRQLFNEFDRFTPDMVMGLVQEQQPVYRHLLYRFRDLNKDTHLGSAGPNGFKGFNSGVLMMNLKHMRESKTYMSVFNSTLVKDLADKYYFKGHLGDQDMYTLLAFEHPGLFLSLPCSWNRQLCVWWRDHGYQDIFSDYWDCNMPIHVWHGNCKTPFPKEMPNT